MIIKFRLLPFYIVILGFSVLSILLCATKGVMAQANPPFVQTTTTNQNLSGNWRDSNGGEIQIVQSGDQIVAIGKNEAVTRWWDRATATLSGQSLTMTYTLAGQSTDKVSGTVLDSNRIQWNNNSTWQRYAATLPSVPAKPSPVKDPNNRGSTLNVHEWLEFNQYLESDNKRFKVVMQGDGNFVTYDDKGTPIWHANTASQGFSRVAMQPDGNLVVYRYADAAYQQRLEVRWESGGRSAEMTKANGQCFAKLLDTGSLAVFSGTPPTLGPQLWTSAPPTAQPPVTKPAVVELWTIKPAQLESIDKYVDNKRMGIFRRRNGKWREESAIDGGTREWIETGADEHSIYLQSNTESIQIDLYLGKIFYSTDGLKTKRELFTAINPVVDAPIQLFSETFAAPITLRKEDSDTLYGRILAAKAVKAAYDLDPETKPDQLKVKHELFGLNTRGQPISGFDANAVVYLPMKRVGTYKHTIVIASNKTHVVVAFRGTDDTIKETIDGETVTLHKWMNGTDNKNKGVPSPIEPQFEGLMVHPGWTQMARDAYSIVLPELRKLNSKGKHVIVTGHSMGGVVSGYVTYLLMRNTDAFAPGMKNQLITFGAPRFGASEDFGIASFVTAFNKEASSKSVSFLSVETNGDEVPTSWRDPQSKEVLGIRFGLAIINRFGTPLNLVSTTAKNSDDMPFHDFKQYYYPELKAQWQFTAP